MGTRTCCWPGAGTRKVSARSLRGWAGSESEGGEREAEGRREEERGRREKIGRR